jgi:hypothetical protein
VAHLFADENFPEPVVGRLRELGHAVTTLQETGKANLSLPDPEVLALAVEYQSVLLTMNRRHFIQIHKEGRPHKGIVVCTFDANFDALAERIDLALRQKINCDSELLRINRPS